MYGYDLFETQINELGQFLDEELTEQMIFDLSSTTIYHRGQGYYDEDAVKEVCFLTENELVAIVSGSRDYNVQILLANHVVSASCNCPYDNICKHIIAVLIQVLLEEVEGPSAHENSSSFQDYLNQCSKKELIGLINRFAPKPFKDYVQNQYLPEDKSSELVERVSNKVYALLDDPDMLWEPDDLGGALKKQLDKLEGLGEKHVGLIFELITAIIAKIEKAQEEGYLYNSYYDQVFDGEWVNKFVRNFIKGLPGVTKVTYLNELEVLIRNAEYSTFDGLLFDQHQFFSEDDIPVLKRLLFANVENGDFRNVEAYYLVIAPILTTAEKLQLLSKVHHISASLVLPLAEIYEAQGELDLAIGVLEEAKVKSNNYWESRQAVLNKLLFLKGANQTMDSSFANEMLDELPSSKTLSQLLDYLPECKKELEGKLRIKSAEDFLNYLIEKNRMEEALTVVQQENSIWEDRKYSFFRKYKNLFKGPAKAYFLQRIDKNLLYTGNDYYAKIVDTLKSLEGVDPFKAKEVKQMIIQNFGRRRNLMKLLR